MIEIVTGEGEVGTATPYTGKMTMRAIKAHLTREAGPDRWAWVKLDGQRVRNLDDLAHYLRTGNVVITQY